MCKKGFSLFSQTWSFSSFREANPISFDVVDYFVWYYPVSSSEVWNDEIATLIEALIYVINNPMNTETMIKKRSSLSFKDEEDDFLPFNRSTSISLLKISSSGRLKHNASILDLIELHLKSSVPSQ